MMASLMPLLLPFHARECIPSALYHIRDRANCKEAFGSHGDLRQGACSYHYGVWRADRGMTQEELAQKAQVARGTIIRAESGAPVNVRTLARLAKALGISVHDLRTVDPDTR